MENLVIWIITAIIVALFLVGIIFLGITGPVENPAAFVISLVIIFVALVVLILRATRK